MQKMSGSASRWLVGAASVAAAMTLAACGGGGGGGGSAEVPQGTLKVSMTDAPACYEHVWVTVKAVRVNKSSTAEDNEAGWKEILPPNGPQRIDLLNLTNGALSELGAAQVDAGAYSQLRLLLESNDVTPLANAVVLPGQTTELDLKTPSAQQSGLKIKGDFTVLADATTAMLLDFDACKSVVKAGNSGQYILKPVVRLAPMVTGSIAGYVTTTMSITATSVTAQQAGQVVRSTRPDASGQFKLAYLPSGTYTVVISSDDRATGVIKSVPVGTVTTTVNGTNSFIVLPTSPMSTVTGVVTATNGNNSTLEKEAFVTATQAISGGSVEVLALPVDFELATYTMRLPTADPMVATYATSGLTFAADTTAAGQYTFTATAPKRSPVFRTVNVRPPATYSVDLDF